MKPFLDNAGILLILDTETGLSEKAMTEKQNIGNQSTGNMASGARSASNAESNTRNLHGIPSIQAAPGIHGAPGIQGKYATHEVRGAHTAKQNTHTAVGSQASAYAKAHGGLQKPQDDHRDAQGAYDEASSVVIFDFALNEQMHADRLEKAHAANYVAIQAAKNLHTSQDIRELQGKDQGDSLKPEDSDNEIGDKDHVKAGSKGNGKGDKDKGDKGGNKAKAKQPVGAGKAGTNKASGKAAKHVETVPNIFQLSNGTVQKSRKNLLWVAVGAIICVAVVAIIVIAIATRPINITINGQELSLSGDKTIEASIEAANVPYNPGNLIAVDGSVIERGGGNLFSATVNGSQAQANDVLNDGDSVIIADGTDIEEESYTEERDLTSNATVDGIGAVHRIDTVGENGSQLVKIGTVSGKEAPIEVLREPTDTKVSRFNINTNGEKIIALTFDDGPSSDYTNSVLDILAQNNAKATFFTIGDRITDSTKAIVGRAFNEGHQVSTHSYDHASGSGQGVNLGYMSDEEQVAEITKGYESIKNATGAECSKTIRTPGGNFGENVIANLAPYITYEIGWNIDTNDWQRPGASVIEERILKASPGDIILMHDGGGNRAQTVDALRAALPKLAAQGYKFVTVDELLEYAS